jgi:2-C-methyl-D-erythritol 4-phosphate cytidylyltransferase
MTILIITACSQEDKEEVQSLLSDKQSQTEEVAVNADEEVRQESANNGIEADSYQASDQANSGIQQSTHKPTSQQKIV